MAVTHLYHILFTKICHLIPTEHSYRKRNMVWLMTGIYFSRSVHLSKIANKLPGKAQRESRVQRFRRFLRNAAVQVRDWYRPIAGQLLSAAARSGVVRLIIDSSKVTAHHQLIMVALAYRRRALPIAWTWMRQAKGHSSGIKQLALLSYVKTLLPSQVTVVLVGDSEFTPLLQAAERWGWFYVLRQKGSHLFRQQEHSPWQRLDTLLTAPGQMRWITHISLTQAHQHSCHLLAWWKPGYEDPWLLATNLPTARQTRQYYRKRMWIEALFGDLKGNGFDLKKSRLHHTQRLSRLTLAVSLLYVWVVAFGATTIKNGWRKYVDRTHRLDLSIFRIGLDMLERCLINNQHISIRDVPYFT